MLPQKSIYKAVIATVRKAFPTPLPIYSDEVLDAFKKPCFFIKFNRTTTTASINHNQQRLYVVLTYFSKNATELEYFEVFDKLINAFGLGFQVDNRFLKIKEIKDERIGDKLDVLQVRLTIDYLDHIDKPSTTNELIEEVIVTVKGDD